MNRAARTEFTVRRLSRATRAAVPTPSGMACLNGTVTAVAAGASVDGVAQVTVTCVDGSVTLSPYLVDAYPSPTVGDVVSVLFTNGSPRILGRLGGFPTF